MDDQTRSLIVTLQTQITALVEKKNLINQLLLKSMQDMASRITTIEKNTLKNRENIAALTSFSVNHLSWPPPQIIYTYFLVQCSPCSKETTTDLFSFLHGIYFRCDVNCICRCERRCRLNFCQNSEHAPQIYRLNLSFQRWDCDDDK